MLTQCEKSLQKVIQLQQCQIHFLIKHVPKEIADMIQPLQPNSSNGSHQEASGSIKDTSMPGPIYPPSSQRIHHAVRSDPLGLLPGLQKCQVSLTLTSHDKFRIVAQAPQQQVQGRQAISMQPTSHRMYWTVHAWQCARELHAEWCRWPHSANIKYVEASSVHDHLFLSFFLLF